MAAISRFLPALRGRRGEMSALARHEAIWGLIFLSPWLIGFLLWTFLPMVLSLVFSFTDFNLLKPDEWRFIGFENYVQFFHDPQVKKSVLVTFRFMLIAVPVGLAVPLALAALLNSKSLWAKPLFRTLFYMPYIVPLISTVYIWRGFLGTYTGWLNRFLESIGIPGPQWLDNVTWIYPALVIIGLWGVGNAMVTMVAGIQNVPTELYDAARVDGAGPLRVFFHVTVPMITPVIFYNLILILIGTFQYFLIPWVIKGTTVGDPGGSTFFYNMYLFKTFFIYDEMGYAATLAWMLFFTALAVTMLLFGTAKYWVYYAGEEE